MTVQILPYVLTFIFGVLATIATQFLTRHFFGLDNTKRKLILANINKIRERLDDYENLFKCEYPELREFVFSYDTLNPKAPFYSVEHPRKVYQALTHYQSLRKVIDDRERSVDEALFFLVRNNVIHLRRRRHIKTVDMMYMEVSLEEEKGTILGKLSEIRDVDYIIFTKFPRKAVTHIDFDELKNIEPENVGKIIHSRLSTKYNPSGKEYENIDNAHWEAEIDLSDARDSLVHHRTKAFKLIREIGVELSSLEQKWAVPS